MLASPFLPSLYYALGSSAGIIQPPPSRPAGILGFTGGMKGTEGSFPHLLIVPPDPPPPPGRGFLLPTLPGCITPVEPQVAGMAVPLLAGTTLTFLPFPSPPPRQECHTVPASSRHQPPCQLRAIMPEQPLTHTKKSLLASTAGTFPRLPPRDQRFLCFNPGEICRCFLAQSSGKSGGREISFYVPVCGDLKEIALLGRVNDKYPISSENQIRLTLGKPLEIVQVSDYNPRKKNICIATSMQKLKMHTHNHTTNIS